MNNKLISATILGFRKGLCDQLRLKSNHDEQFRKSKYDISKR